MITVALFSNHGVSARSVVFIFGRVRALIEVVSSILVGASFAQNDSSSPAGPGRRGCRQNPGVPAPSIGGNGRALGATTKK